MPYHILSKQEAWNTGVDERNIPIDKSVHPFKFTRNWFKYRNQTTFSTFLPARWDGSQPVRMIQIGVFEGMDLVWQFQNTLKHPKSFVFAIDPWTATTKLEADAMEEVYQRALWNLRPYRGKCHVFRGLSQTILQTAVQAGRLAGVPSGGWDLIVIDGDHRKDAVIRDATLALQLVKPGGWLLFDDVRTQVPKKDEVEVGLRAFLEIWGDQVGLAWAHRFCDCYEKLQEKESEDSHAGV